MGDRDRRDKSDRDREKEKEKQKQKEPEKRKEPRISSGLAINLDQSLLEDGLNFLGGEAYFRRFLMNRVTGREADCLWGPDLDLMVKAPPSLSNIQDLGAARRFRCFSH